jgi:tRNA(adenine34) deaminase
VLYTTAEPCLLCSFAIREARIERIVIGTSVPHIGGATSPYPILSAADVPPWGAPPTIVWGVLQKECEALRR